MMFSRRFFVLGGASSLMGCVARGSLMPYDGVQQVQRQPIIAATNRAALDSSLRTDVLSFSQIDVAVPKDREIGTVPVSGANGFSVVQRENLGSMDALQGSLAEAGANAPLILWVHGYNNTAAEAIYRQAQLAVDAQMSGPQVAFVWPSAGQAGGYIHDRDSVLHARQPLSDLIDVLRQVWPGEIILVAHSLGAFLAMETLGQRARNGKKPRDDVDVLALLQPDIALDVFRVQVRDATPLPVRTAVVAAETDPALRLSARISQSEKRVGAHVARPYYDDLGVELLDVTALSDASQPHLVAFSSPVFLSYLRQLEQLNGGG